MPLRATWAGLAAVVTLAALAQRGPTTAHAWSLASTSSSASSSGSGSSADGTVGEEIQAVVLAQDWFKVNSADNLTYLAVGVNSALSNITEDELICGGVPSLQRRTTAMMPNNGCPAIFTAIDGSCTCLPDYSGLDTWEFLVTTSTSDDAIPVSLNATDVLPIDAIRTLLVPSTVNSLAITGVGEEPQTIAFVPQDVDLPGSALPIAVNEENINDATSITAVRFENINMATIVMTAAYFLPPTIRNLTLRNCALENFGYDFFQGVSTIQNLDLSSNKLVTAYAGNAIGKTCTTQFCAVQILNLTGNQLTAFPTVVFNVDDLQELYLRDNSITDFNVSSSVFQAISALNAYESDQPDESAPCTAGTWQTTHGVTFCVLNESVASEEVSTSNANYLVYIAIAAGALVLVLLLVFLWMKYCHRPDLERLSSSSKSYSTRASNADDTQHEVNPVFLEDPVIVTNRIEYKQLKLGRCISKGGFGLVFAGEYKGHRVAIKKIRPDRSGDVAEIEVFLKEIILMAVLYHPRIVEFIGVAWNNLRHLSAVTEFMDNGDLRNVLHGLKEQGAPLTWDTHKATIALHIAEALSYLHSLKPKVIHRDLKSKNVLLNMYLEAKLSDFGISRMRYVVETHMTAGVGTSFWIAPEVLLGRDYDEAADIYSFGVVLSEIDTDDYPYWNDANPDVAHGQIQEAEILSQVAAGQLRPDFSADCPEEILDLADCCLQQNPKDRPSAAEVVAVLLDLMHPSRRPSSQSLSSDSGSSWSVRRASKLLE